MPENWPLPVRPAAPASQPMDTVDRATRSRIMSRIRGRDTRPELVVRRFLHANGFRYRLHARHLPGSPDIVLPRHRAAVFVHGCFWHGHSCRAFRWPKTKPDYWRGKIQGNQVRDAQAIDGLLDRGWRAAIVWECSIKEARSDVDALGRVLIEWILADGSLDLPEVLEL